MGFADDRSAVALREQLSGKVTALNKGEDIMRPFVGASSERFCGACSPAGICQRYVRYLHGQTRRTTC
jgi:hypothetical protein